MSFAIRQATAADADVIVEFNIRLASETERKTLDRGVVAKGVARVLSSQELGTYYVAESGSDVIGQLLITREWSDWRNGTFWWIQSVYVANAWRGHKVFTALYEYVLSRAKLADDVCGIRLYVEHENERAKGTYRKLGMTETAYRLYEVDFTEERPA